MMANCYCTISPICKKIIGSLKKAISTTVDGIILNCIAMANCLKKINFYFNKPFYSPISLQGKIASKCFFTLYFTSSKSTTRPSSCAKEVTFLFWIPHGAIWSKYERSVLILNANPCMVIHLLHFIPIAQIFLSLPLICASNHTPVSPALHSPFKP